MPRTTKNHLLTYAASASEMLPPNPRRVGLIISPPNNTSVWISLREPAVVGRGILMIAGNYTPLQLDIDFVGPDICETLSFISTGGGNIGVVEIMDT